MVVILECRCSRKYQIRYFAINMHNILLHNFARNTQHASIHIIQISTYLMQFDKFIKVDLDDDWYHLIGMFKTI